MNPRATPAVFAPFRSRDYRFQWIADLATSWAFEMEMLILGWYVLVTTESVFWLSVVGALHYMGTLMAPVLGVVGDRIGPRNLLCLMRAVYTVLAATLTFLFISDQASLTLVLIVAGLLGVVKPSDIGVRGALVAHIVSSQQLGGAVAWSRTTADSARIVGALTGTGLFAVFGIAVAYMLVTYCYLIGFLMTLGVSAPKRTKSKTSTSPFRSLGEGLRYVWDTPHIQAGMWLAFLVNLTAFPLSMGLMPYIAKNVYGLDQNGLGLLVASFAVGAFVGSIAIAMLRDRIRPGQAMLIGTLFWYFFLFGFVLTTDSQLGMILLMGAGFMQSFSMILLALMLLRTSDPSIRVRVMGVRMLAIYSLPVGLLLAGVLIPRIGYIATAGGYTVVGILFTILIGLFWRQSVWTKTGPANA